VALAGEAGLGHPEDLAGLDPDEQLHEACARVFAVAHDRLAAPTDPRPLEPADLRDQIRGDLQVFAEHYRHIDVDAWTDRMVDELFGLGPLEAVLAEVEVRDVFIHGPDRVLARRGSAAPRSIGARFSCPQAIEAVVRRLTGTAFGVDNPVIDARTFGGQEVYAVHETVAAGGPVVDIRVQGAHDIAYSLSHMVATGAMTPTIAQLLDACVLGGLNIAICAGPGAQAFPLLAALSEAAPEEQRQLVVRPGHEPGLLPANAVVLEGAGLVGTEGSSVMQALVRTAMGLAPDRLLVHDVAGPEAADVFAAMGRGLQGTVITLRASTTGAGLARLGTLIGLAGGSSDVSTRTLYAAQAIELMIAVSRFADGQSRVTQVSEPVLSPTGAPMVVDLVTIDPQTRNWTHTGVVPTFAPELQRRGIRLSS
jgi:pilus assembly protein CpaF